VAVEVRVEQDKLDNRQQQVTVVQELPLALLVLLYLEQVEVLAAVI
jgi:hypothetical protein